MLIHKGANELDVQPSRVAAYERKGWSRGPAPDVDSPDLDAMDRDQLNEFARTVGVTEPEKLPNKDAVKAAITDQA